MCATSVFEVKFLFLSFLVVHVIQKQQENNNTKKKKKSDEYKKSKSAYFNNSPLLDNYSAA